MRILGVLVALQCAGIAFLVYRAVADGPTPVPGAATPVTVAGPVVPAGPAPAMDPGEERLRQIIREELAALPVPAGPGTQPAATAAPRDPERDRAMREQVAARIDHYRSVGAISPAEMQALQNDIAKLDPASRREMLSQLVRAMNAREIQGQM